MKNSREKIIKALSIFCILYFAFLICVKAQEMPPKPSAPRTLIVPAVQEGKLRNGLGIAVVERKNIPIVTVRLLVKSGADVEDAAKAGLAEMTASLLTKGTTTRTATQIAEDMEFLGGSINTGAGWNTSVVNISVMSDKLEQAMGIMSDIVINPAFKQEELDLLKSQSLDGLTYNLKDPAFLANYVASKYSFDEHPADGTPESLNAITRDDIIKYEKENYLADNIVLIFTGDITAVKAKLLAQKYFGGLKSSIVKAKSKDEAARDLEDGNVTGKNDPTFAVERPILNRLLVVDLPNSGQAAVTFAKNDELHGRIDWDDKKNTGMTSKSYFPAVVLNSVLGGGYSSRLNQEIRIKRGLSYGAGSAFAWRAFNSKFSTRTQTDNLTAAQVAQLVVGEVQKLTDTNVAGAELLPRKWVLTGDFGRDLETTEGLATAVADLYSFHLPAGELNAYTKNVNVVTDAQIRNFAKGSLPGGDIIIVGDYAKFKDDLAKRFPAMKVDVIKADELDLSKENLKK